MYHVIMYWNYGKKFFEYFIEDKTSFYKYFILSFIVGVLELFGVALAYPFINKLIACNGFNKTTIIYGISIIFAFLAKNIFMIFYNYLQANFTKNCEANIDKKFLHYFIFGDYNIISKTSFSKKQQILGFLIPSAINNFLMRILNLTVNIFVFILIVAFLFFKFFIATCVTITCAILLLILQTYYFKNKTKKLSSNINKAQKELNDSINIPLLNLKTLKILNCENFFFNKYKISLELFQEITKKLTFFGSIPSYITEPCIIIILFVLLLIISIQNYLYPNNLIASYAVIALAIFRLTPTISRIQVNIVGISTAFPQVKELIQIYESLSIANFVYKDKPYKNFNSTIELKNICFSYGDKVVLENVNFKIKKGDFIGIVGPSGAGKTTLLDIITSLLPIKEGEILIDGISENSNFAPKFRIGYIPQDYETISASIRENVAFGAEIIDDNKVIEALKMAQLYDFILENYKEGIYATPFVDSIGFSQGQKQRLSIARALYTNPDIIILDEATSSLDLKTEDEICKVLNQYKGNKTIIAIAHRISTIKNADIIYLMQNTTIADKGTFTELYNRVPEFKTYVDLNNSNTIH